MISSIAQSLVHDLTAVLREVIDAYASRKREAAVLDFDDLLSGLGRSSANILKSARH